jgi:hypothetical protein
MILLFDRSGRSPAAIAYRIGRKTDAIRYSANWTPGRMDMVGGGIAAPRGPRRMLKLPAGMSWHDVMGNRREGDIPLGEEPAYLTAPAGTSVAAFGKRLEALAGR